ncbi:lysine exporter LysO family protein [uncultured Mailhella sp.]|uniref:lysine exporter LysO family protein n=1 Tax=uncultured Mailhella sp. TaxID=1981031 RepID=UPI0025ECA985|nr:lysine exporter LysO family protein [uncultured Mailhella sp.]
MLLEMGLIAGGIPAGWVLRRNAAVVTRVNEALAWTVRVMLFLLGLALGLDDALLGQLKSLGLYAVLISSFSVAGCFLVARMLGRHVFLEYAPGKGGAAAGERGGSRGSFVALAFFVTGVIIGTLRILSVGSLAGEAAVWVLYLLLVLAGMTVGFDLKALGIIRELRYRILLIPLGVVAGTLCGSALAWLVLSCFSTLSLPEALAVGAGFGYYSLATVIITSLGDPALGSVALLSNMIHEALALLLPPLIVRFTGRLGPVLAGGAAAMDTCLPVIAQVSGERCAVLALFSGMSLTLLVPVIVPLLMALR